MTDYDWADQARTDSWTVLQVDPLDPDTVRGEIGMVTDISYTWGYYSDTRGSATIKALGDDYIAHSQLRIVHEVPEWDYVNEVFTGYVTGISKDINQGTEIVTYTVSSPLYALQVDIQGSPFTVAKGGKAKTAMASLLERCVRPYSIDSLAKDYRFTSTKVYPVGDTHLSTLFDLVDLSYNRLSVDGHGLVTVLPYTSPSALTPTWYLDDSDPMGMILSEDIAESTTEFDVPGRIIVTHTDGDTKYVGVADAGATLDSSSKKRGYMLAELHDLTDLSNGTKAAEAKAKSLLNSAQDSYLEWQLETLYMPMREGDCVQLTLDGTGHHCLAKTIDCNPLEGTMKITLKEV